MRLRWLLFALIGLIASILPMSGVSAAEQPADAGDSAAGAGAQAEAMPDDSAGGVEVLRYAGSDPYKLSIEVAQAVVDAGGGASEWVVLVSGESWIDAATAGPLAASLGAPVVLVPPGGLQTATARPDLVEFLRWSGVRRVVIVGSPDVLPNHEPSVLYGLGMLPRNIERIHGDDPIGTSVAVAERVGPPAELGELGRTVIIVSEQRVADAVAIGPLAAAGPFPLLLTAPNELDPRITTYLAEHDVAHAALVGGTAAIAPAVQEAIEAAGSTVSRLAGRDRSDTARLAADLFEQHTADSPACPDGPLRIGLTPGLDPEQALTTGPVLARECVPLRYTEPDRLPADLRNSLFLASHRPEGARVTVFADETQIPTSDIVASVPPAQMAFEGGWPPDHPRHGEFAVVIVDERGHWLRYPIESDHSPGIDPDGWGSEVLQWSPNGRYLAYISARDHQLLIIDVETGRVRKSELEGVRLRFSRWHFPMWSPDSSLLAFSAFPVGEEFAEVFLFDSKTGSTTRLTHNDTADEVVAWSPDSASVAMVQAQVGAGFFSVAPYSSYLVVTDIETGATTQLHASRLGNLRVLWAPDGRHLAFSGWVEGLEVELGLRAFVVRPDGSDLQQVPPEPAIVWAIDWDAAGLRLLYSKNYSASHMPTQSWIRDLSTGKDSRLDFIDYGPSNPLGWSRDQRGIIFHRLAADSPEMLMYVDVETGGVTPLLELQVGDDRRRTIGLSGDERQMAFVVDNKQLIIVNSLSPLGTRIIDFSPEIHGGPNDGCFGSWTENGIRGSCMSWRDI